MDICHQQTKLYAVQVEYRMIKTCKTTALTHRTDVDRDGTQDAAAVT